MKYKKKTTQVLPVKVSDSFYADLRYVAEKNNTTMAGLIRGLAEPAITKEAKRLRTLPLKKNLGLYGYMASHQFKGKIHYKDKTDDELLYGGNFDK